MLQIIKPNTNIPFMTHIKPFYIVVSLLALVGLITPFILSPNWGTSFSGGTSITMHFDGDVSTDELRQAFVDDPRFESVSVQSIGSEDNNVYIVKTRSTTTLVCSKLDEIEAVLPAKLKSVSNQDVKLDSWPACNAEDQGIRGDFFVKLSVPVVEGELKSVQGAAPIESSLVEKAFNEAGLEASVAYDDSARRYVVKPSGIQSEIVSLLSSRFGERFDSQNGIDEIVTVGSDVGEKFRNDAIVSLVIALALMLLYIAIRFDMRYAPAAVVSLAMSVLITFGIITFLRLEMTLETVAAMLSLVGYGINDTIVNFDRIRENLSGAEVNTSLIDIVNRSVNDCLSRTILTSITTLIAVLPMVIYATGATQNFALILCIGIIVCTLNTIIISCPSVLIVNKWMQDSKKKQEIRQKLEEELQV